MQADYLVGEVKHMKVAIQDLGTMMEHLVCELGTKPAALPVEEAYKS